MNDHERLSELARLIDSQRTICERLYQEWHSACKAVSQFEREQSLIFRRMMRESPATTPAERG